MDFVLILCVLLITIPNVLGGTDLCNGYKILPVWTDANATDPKTPLGYRRTSIETNNKSPCLVIKDMKGSCVEVRWETDQGTSATVKELSLGIVTSPSNQGVFCQIFDILSGINVDMQDMQMLFEFGSKVTNQQELYYRVHVADTALDFSGCKTWCALHQRTDTYPSSLIPKPPLPPDVGSGDQDHTIDTNPSTDTKLSSLTGTTTAVVIVGVLFVILAVAVFVFLRKRQAKARHGNHLSLEMAAHSSDFGNAEPAHAKINPYSIDSASDSIDIADASAFDGPPHALPSSADVLIDSEGMQRMPVSS